MAMQEAGELEAMLWQSVVASHSASFLRAHEAKFPSWVAAAARANTAAGLLAILSQTHHDDPGDPFHTAQLAARLGRAWRRLEDEQGGTATEEEEEPRRPHNGLVGGDASSTEGAITGTGTGNGAASATPTATVTASAGATHKTKQTQQKHRRVLVVGGAEDRIAPAAEVRRLAEALRAGGAAVDEVVMEGAGHMMAIEQPVVWRAAVLRFLNHDDGDGGRDER
jgi:pimeloyl-ACP methyl ester carboxylesterase